MLRLQLNKVIWVFGLGKAEVGWRKSLTWVGDDQKFCGGSCHAHMWSDWAFLACEANDDIEMVEIQNNLL